MTLSVLNAARRQQRWTLDLSLRCGSDLLIKMLSLFNKCAILSDCVAAVSVKGAVQPKMSPAEFFWSFTFQQDPNLRRPRDPTFIGKFWHGFRTGGRVLSRARGGF